MTSDLLQRWRDGDQEAARLLFEQYARQLTLLARKHLSRKLGGRLDGEDIVQSVFRTFFRRSAQGEFRIDASLDLWHLLAKITLAKVRSQARRHTAGMRNVHAEARRFQDEADWLPAAIAAGPSPEAAAILVDQIEVLLAGLPEVYADILGLCLDGHSKTQIAAQVGVARQTVHRALNLLRQRLQVELNRT